MRVETLVRALPKILALLFLLTLSIQATAQNANDSLRQSLPDQIGDFRAAAPARSSTFQGIRQEDFNITNFTARSYRSENNGGLVVTLVQTENDSSAFALLTRMAQRARENETLTQTQDIGRAGFISPARIIFFKGAAFVEIRGEGQGENSNDNRINAARAIAETLDVGANAFPPLVEHLPDWPDVQERAVYTVSLAALQEASGNQPLLNELTFNPATEAATASYDPGMRLVIVEYRTPQLAGETDRRISARIEELRQNGEGVPSVYRRTGNYLVFVFGGNDQVAAARLADGVRYEQQITWLDENPFALRQAQRNFDIAATSLILAAFKFSGIALIFCMIGGSIFGAIIFWRRRAQVVDAGVYTDAGDMVRLNIDDLTPPTNRSLLNEKRDE